MKLNSAKYAFEVSSGKFLGFMVSQRGIKVNPKKVKAILEMTSLRNRFVSRVTDKYLLFFKTLK